ncbi:MAG: hypothetical protein M1834_002009 [Cirrosporium novae-zelandiae]|nr:MAG: hypothetical protein M1834_002009 [Cirrosporium novae-zelandiae]
MSNLEPRTFLSLPPPRLPLPKPSAAETLRRFALPKPPKSQIKIKNHGAPYYVSKPLRKSAQKLTKKNVFSSRPSRQGEKYKAKKESKKIREPHPLSGMFSETLTISRSVLHTSSTHILKFIHNTLLTRLTNLQHADSLKLDSLAITLSFSHVGNTQIHRRGPKPLDGSVHEKRYAFRETMERLRSKVMETERGLEKLWRAWIVLQEDVARVGMEVLGGGVFGGGGGLKVERIRGEDSLDEKRDGGGMLEKEIRSVMAELRKKMRVSERQISLRERAEKTKMRKMAED